jgi:hypothetical protein
MDITYRRPSSHLRDLRERAQKVEVLLERNIKRSKAKLPDNLRKCLEDPRLKQYLNDESTKAANFIIQAVLSWVLGDGLSPRVLDRTLCEVEGFDYNEPNTDVSAEIKKAVRNIEKLRKDERYDVYNLPIRNYTEDVLHHWLKSWKYIESRRFNDEEIEVIYCDITKAIEKLPEREKNVVNYYKDGFSLEEIEKMMGIEAWRSYNKAKKLLAGILLNAKQ